MINKNIYENGWLFYYIVIINYMSKEVGVDIISDIFQKEIIISKISWYFVYFYYINSFEFSLF